MNTYRISLVPCTPFFRTPLFSISFTCYLLLAVCLSGTPVFAKEQTKLPATKNAQIVTIDNFVKIKTAQHFAATQKRAGGVNQWAHRRNPTPIDQQNITRMNRDTLYSAAIVNIKQGATLTLPDSGSRYFSVMIVNENHFINRILHDAGSYSLTQDEHETPYVMVVARVFVDPNNPADVALANRLQDQLALKAVSTEPFTANEFDQPSFQHTHQLLLELSKSLPDASRAYGSQANTDAVRHLLGTASGWGGLPESEVIYINRDQNKPAGDYQLSVKDVPVDGFWSISVYNKDGYFEETPHHAYSMNSVTAKPNEDGSYIINFGTNPKGKQNFIQVMEGWNYVIRLYQPRSQIRSGEWRFPAEVSQ